MSSEFCYMAMNIFSYFDCTLKESNNYTEVITKYKAIIQLSTLCPELNDEV